MIATFEDIKKVRSIANNINDVKRVEPYIKEAETLDVLPVIGAGLYRQLDNLTRVGGLVITNNANERIELTEELLNELLNGAYYECDGCGCNDDNTRYTEGLISAIAYLTYARFLPNNPINATAFGNMQKLGEFSQPIEEKATVRASKEAEKIGLEYLRQCVDFMRCKNIISNRKKVKIGRRKFKTIGD